MMSRALGALETEHYDGWHCSINSAPATIRQLVAILYDLSCVDGALMQRA